MEQKRYQYKVRSEDLFQVEKELGETLYHYTDFCALDGILRRKELWLGSLASMNDKSEIVGCIARTEQILEGYELSDAERKLVADVVEILKSNLCEEYPFSLSFSPYGDDASMWERYAGHAKGVAIAFRADRLREFALSVNASLRKVDYSFDLPQEYHEKIIGAVRQNFAAAEGANAFLAAVVNIIRNAPYRKDGSFRSENEVRLCRYAGFGVLPFERTKEFAVTPCRIRKILKMDLVGYCKGDAARCSAFLEELIERIVIGPHSEQSEHELKQYLTALGYRGLAQKIAFSACPLR